MKSLKLVHYFNAYRNPKGTSAIHVLVKSFLFNNRGMYTVHKWSALVANIWNILTEALLIPFIWFQVPRSTQLLRYTTMCNITLDIVLELHFSSWLQQSMKTWLIMGNFYDHDLNLTCFCKRNCKNEIDSKHDQTITKRSRRKICFFSCFDNRWWWTYLI